MKTIIDLRSDTVTKPCSGMLKAMTMAEVGDDVFAEDPTVAKLEAVLAERAGHEAGLFFPSGTQSNLVALLAQCQRGDEYIVGQNAHTYRYEGGGAAVLGSIQPQPIEHAADGSIPLNKIEAAIKIDDFHFARTKMLALENTIGGKVISQDYLKRARSLAASHGLTFHLDGARVFNAVVAQGIELEHVSSLFDSVSICLSKGLGAPVGSVLVSSQGVITEARRWRKMVGGGMRQAGILAAAGLFALDHNIDALAQDHDNAQRLAGLINGIAGLEVLGEGAHTNMVFIKVGQSHRSAFINACGDEGLLFTGGEQFRLVLHKDISPSMTETAAEIICRVSDGLQLVA